MIKKILNNTKINKMKRLMFIFLTSFILLSLTNRIDAQSFGRTEGGGSPVFINNVIRGSKFKCPEDGNATSITVKISNTWGSSRKIKCAIYRVNDNTLVGETNQKTINVSGSWEIFNFTSPVSLSANTEYYLVCWADGSATSMDAQWVGGTGNMYNDSETYNSFPNLWNPLDDSKGNEACIYVNYIPADITVSGRLKDIDNNPVQGKFIIYQPATDNIVISTQTDANGNYDLTIQPGEYNLQVNLAEFWIKISSVNINLNFPSFFSHITQYQNEISFAIDITDSKEIQIYNKIKPSKILKNATAMPAVSTLSNLKTDTWFFDPDENKLSLIVGPGPVLFCGNGMLDEGEECDVNLPCSENYNCIDCKCIVKREWPIRSVCVFPYDDYYSKSMDKKLNEIQERLPEVNFIEIRTYWKQDPSNSNNMIYDERNIGYPSLGIGESSWSELEAAAKKIHARGLGVNLWLVGSVPSLTNYSEWLDNYAIYAKNVAEWSENNSVEIFVIGAEYPLDMTSDAYSDKWINIISQIRSVYTGKVVYGFNWWYTKDQWEKIINASWINNLDYIQIDSFQNLGKHIYDLNGNVSEWVKYFNPTIEDLMGSWTNHHYGWNYVERYRELSEKFNKKILIDIGYRNNNGTNTMPWKNVDLTWAGNPVPGSGPDVGEMNDCWEAFFRTWMDESFIIGVDMEHYTQPNTNSRDGSFRNKYDSVKGIYTWQVIHKWLSQLK